MTAAPRPHRPRGALVLRRPDATIVPALLAGISIGTPLLVLLLTNHLDLLGFAAFGGFTALYGRNEPYAVRGRMLAAVAAWLSLSVAVGAAAASLSGSFWVRIAAVALFAGLSKLLADAARVSPPGGLMPTFAVAVTAELTLTPAHILPAVAVTAAVGVWSWLVCMSGRLVRAHGPERVAVSRALDAVAARLEAVGKENSPVRHASAVAVQRAWHAVGSGRASEDNARLEALLAHAESAMREARLAGHGRAELNPVHAAELRALAREVRGARGVPTVPITPDERAELDGLRAGEALNDPGATSDPASPSDPATDSDPTAASDAATRNDAATTNDPAAPNDPARLNRPTAAGHRGNDLRLLRLPDAPWGTSLGRLSLSAPFVPMAIRVTVGAAAAGVIAHLVGLGHTSWACVSAVAVLQASNLTTTMNRSIQRALGTLSGIVIGLLALLFNPGVGVTVLLVIVFQVFAELVVMVNYALGLMFATPLALLLAHVGHPTPSTILVRDRLADTLVGAIVAILAALLVPNRRLANAVRRQVGDAEGALAAAASVEHDAPRSERSHAARHLAAQLFALREAYDAAAGEPWPDDLPAERVIQLERDGHTELARLTY